MDQYTVTGMSCAACQARVEKAVSKVPGRRLVVLGQPSHELDGRGGKCRTGRYHQGSDGCRLRRTAKGSRKDFRRSLSETGGGGGRPEGQGDAGSQETSHRVSGISRGAHVFFDGAHDVGIPAPSIFRRESRGDGASAASSCWNCHGHQPEILYQRF